MAKSDTPANRPSALTALPGLLAPKLFSRIYEVRRVLVMLDSDLAELYGVDTRTLNQAVQRNKERFPEDFLFRLSQEEASA